MLPTAQWRDLIDHVAADHPPLPGDVFEAMVLVESNGDPKVKSASNAIGLSQVIWKWHSTLVDKIAAGLQKLGGEQALYDPEINLRVGAAHLVWCFTSSGSSSWELAVTKYFTGSANPPPGFVDGQGTSPNQHITKLRAALKLVREDRASIQENPMVELTFGRVPHPGYVDMTYIADRKIEGIGWDNLGKRNPKFIAIHRMWGTLAGTDSYFAPANSPHLTDYAIGVLATDGMAKAGEIHKYNNPLGYKSGWASGRVSAPYGDGKAFVDKYGINAVNRDGVSVELAGFDDTPVDDFSWSEYVWLCAYWIDQMKIPYTSLPINPWTGIGAFIWHEEFTFGTGKKCPFKYLKANTKRLIADVKTFLKPYQEGTVGGEQPELEIPTPVTPLYATPVPIAELVPFADRDRDVMTALTTREADQFIFVADRVEATTLTPRLQYASMTAPHVGPDLKVGEQFDVDWMVKAGDGNWYYITAYWTRIRVDHTKRIADAEAA